MAHAIPEKEAVALQKLHDIFLNEIRYHVESKIPREVIESDVHLTFHYMGRNYTGIFKLTSVGEIINGKKICSIIRFDNDCSYLRYSYIDRFSYSSKIRANRGNVTKGYMPCFEPQLAIEQGSADVLQILSTKIRLLIPEHRPIIIIDEAEKDGLYISKYKLLRGESTIYEKYGYVSEDITYIKDTIHQVPIKVIESKQILALLEEKLGRKINQNELIVNIMSQIPKENEKVIYYEEIMEFDEEDGMPIIIRSEEGKEEYISNIVYDFLANLYHFTRLTLTFDEGSSAWQAIKDRVLITDVDLISSKVINEPMENNNMSGGKRKCKTKRRQSKRKTKRRAKKN